MVLKREGGQDYGSLVISHRIGLGVLGVSRGDAWGAGRGMAEGRRAISLFFLGLAYFQSLVFVPITSFFLVRTKMQNVHNPWT